MVTMSNSPSKSTLAIAIGLPTVPAICAGVGSFFSPASAAAAGGTLKIIGVCVIGGVCTIIPALIAFAGIALFAVLGAFNNFANYMENRPYLGLLGFLALSAATTLVIGFAALIAPILIGAAIFGVAAAPLINCFLVGALVMAASTLALLYPLETCLACIGIRSEYSPNRF